MITNRLKLFAAAGSILSFSAAATAGHHFETALAQKHPQFDLQDVYAFMASAHGKTAFVMTFNPQGKAGSSDTFGKNGLYHFHVGEDTTMTKGKTFTFQFINDHVHGYLADSASPKFGVKGKEFGQADVGRTEACGNGIRFWTGTVEDPFTGNGAALGAFKEAVNKGNYDENTFSKSPGDLFINSICGAIVFEVPNSMLRNDRKLWMRAAAGTPIESCDWLGGGSLLNTVNKGDSLDDFVKLSIPVESTPAFLGLQA